MVIWLFLCFILTADSEDALGHTLVYNPKHFIGFLSMA